MDVHSPQQADIAKDFADIVQVPAFCAGKPTFFWHVPQRANPLMLKRVRFWPQDMAHVVQKLREGGACGISVTERGTSFGYQNLVVDMRGLAIMREIGVPVVFDATHSVQLPGAGGGKSGGQREFVMPLARAAVAVGCDAIYAEVHHKPEIAKSDGPNALTFPMLDELMGTLKRIAEATQKC